MQWKKSKKKWRALESVDMMARGSILSKVAFRKILLRKRCGNPGSMKIWESRKSGEPDILSPVIPAPNEKKGMMESILQADTVGKDASVGGVDIRESWRVLPGHM